MHADLREKLFMTMGVEGQPVMNFRVNRDDYAVLTPICGTPPLSTFRKIQSSDMDAVIARDRHKAQSISIEMPPELKKRLVMFFLDHYDERGIEAENERLEVRNSLHSCSFEVDCLWSTIREYVLPIWWREIDEHWAKMCAPELVAKIRTCGRYRQRVFRNGSSDSAALASFPGSGNTWSRLLLEYGSGIFTGSIYDDIDLMRLLPAEGADGSAVLAVKTHVHPSKYIIQTGAVRVLLLVRHPFDAIWAEYQRRHAGGHASSVELSYGTVAKFGGFAQCMACKWLRYTLIHANMVFASRERKLLVVRYEDLVKSTVATLRRMLLFLGVSSSRRTVCPTCSSQ